MKSAQTRILVVVVITAVLVVTQRSNLSASTWTRNSFGETLQIDTQGYVSLNGRSIIAIGFHLKHGGNNPSSTIANSMLQRLSNDGIRFIVFNFEGMESDSQIVTDINFWMPLLVNYRMWVFLQVQHLKPEPPTLSPSVQMPRNQLVVNTISQNPAWAHMVFAYSFTWELDIWFNDVEVTTYLAQMTPQIRSLLIGSAIGNVPILSKPCGPWNDNHGTVPMGAFADLIGMDYYFSITSSGSGVYSSAVTNFENILHNQYLNQCGKSGYAIWHTEWGILGNGVYNHEITASMFSQLRTEMGYNDCSAIMIWLMWTQQTDNHAAFNSDGSPTQWYLNISGLLKPTL